MTEEKKAEKTMEKTEKTAEKPRVNDAMIERMFKAGAHFGYSKSRRHPSTKALIFGAKNKVEIFDLEKTKDYLDRAKEVVKAIAAHNGVILFVGGKSESRDAILKGAQSIDMPYVSGRWIGGTFTNFPQIRKRVERLEMLTSQREKGELSKYTKKERLLIDREIDTLNRFFSGIVSLKEMPKAMFVIDSDREHIAVEEAHKAHVPVIALCGSDCNLKNVEFPIPGNDASVASITFFVNEMVNAYKEGRNTEGK